jgi:hypothetical protein
MGAQKVLGLKQGNEGRLSGFISEVLLSRCVLFKPSPPILLPLTADPRKPLAMSDLSEETQQNRKPYHLKTPIIEMGPQCMDRSTIRTTVPLEPHRFLKAIKKPAHITMTPQPWASAPRTARRTGPRILLSHLLHKLDIQIAIQYQVRSLWGITEGTTPAGNAPSVIPFLSLQLILRRKRTYTIYGEILGRGLGRIM